MADISNTPAFKLAESYAKFFVEDAAATVVKHLSGSYPTNEAAMSQFIHTSVENAVSQPAISETNVVTRFLYECAEYALSNQVENPDSRQAWDSVKNLSSLHHAELNALSYTNALLYKKTIERTIVNTVMKDAHVATKAIAQAAQVRTMCEDTGGSLHMFSWGILNDGIWLNSALLKAFDLASIFRPGEQVVSYYTEVAFNFARSYAYMEPLSREAEVEAAGQLSALLGSIDNPELDSLIGELSAGSLEEILFSPSGLFQSVNRWESATIYASAVVPVVGELSTLARILSTLTSLPKNNDIADELISNRLQKSYDVVMLVLAGMEALRETKYAEALIVSVAAQGDDPKVDVIVNNDLMHAYHSSGGEESDLIHFGLYLDPRRGIPASNNGWSMSYVQQRRDDIVAQMMAESSDRLDRLRSNDAGVILNEATRIITDVASSYASAKGQEGLNGANGQQINHAARMLINNDPTFEADKAIADVLLFILDDPFVRQSYDTFMSHVSETPDRQAATIKAVADMAIKDYASYVS